MKGLLVPGSDGRCVTGLGYMDDICVFCDSVCEGKIACESFLCCFSIQN